MGCEVIVSGLWLMAGYGILKFGVLLLKYTFDFSETSVKLLFIIHPLFWKYEVCNSYIHCLVYSK